MATTLQERLVATAARSARRRLSSGGGALVAFKLVQLPLSTSAAWRGVAGALLALAG